MLLGQVTLIQVKFLQCDDKMGPEDYQELQNSDKLDGNKKLLAFIWKEEGKNTETVSSAVKCFDRQ